MNIPFEEGVAFTSWLEDRGLAPRSYLKEMVFSNNYKVLDEKLGYTGENVYNQVKELLAEK